MTTIQDLEERLDSFEKTLLQMSRNLVPVTSKADDAYNIAEAATPYTETKVGYFGEIEKVFYGVPSGNVSVFFDNYTGEYEKSRIEDRLTIRFPERLTDMTNINISVQ